MLCKEDVELFSDFTNVVLDVGSSKPELIVVAVLPVRGKDPKSPIPVAV